MSKYEKKKMRKRGEMKTRRRMRKWEKKKENGEQEKVRTEK